MTSTPVVTPVVPPMVRGGSTSGRQPGRGTSRRVLPLAALAATRVVSAVHGVAAVDRDGRVADATVMDELGWVPGTRLDIQESGGLVVVQADRRGVFRVSGQGYLRLPAAARHWCRLAPGDRVLLAADPGRGRLVVYPPAALDIMVNQFQAAVFGGDAA
ncbi:MAG: hypothetical protein V7603_1570 [Micromonosporaceae bacterium]